MGPERTRCGVLVLCFAASCTAEPVADVGELSAGENEAAGTSSTPPTSDASSGATSSASSDEGSSGAVDDTAEAESGGPMLDVGSDGVAGCANAAEQYMYLITPERALHRYDPETGMVESLGTPDCGMMNVNAMTIDRDGLLWVQGVDMIGYRLIYTLDAETLECVDTGYGDPDGYTSGGLAFVADAPDSDEETLYVGMVTAIAPDVGLTVARIDLETMAAEVVGELTPVGDAYQLPDLTGTGDARLFGFFNSGPIVAEIDETAADVVEEHMVDFMPGSPWAFAQWGARLWLFGNNGEGGSRVVAWDPASGDIEEIDPALPVQVVGAAVSTCAPYEPEG